MAELTEIDIDSLLGLNIPSFRVIVEDSVTVGVRGRTLSSPNRRWMLKRIKTAGINTMIDLRAGDLSDSFASDCEEAELEYLHFPMDKFRTAAAVIISNLPKFIQTINSGKFYISCALGLHRTDIALSLHYIFDPKNHEPPVLYGHITDGKLRYDDIFQRAGSIYHNLTEADRKQLGWDDSFEQEYAARKKELIRWQEKYINLS